MAVKFIKSDEGYEQGHCPVSVVELDGFSPSKIINTISYSNDIYENSSFYHETVSINPIYPSGDTSQNVSGFLIQYYETDPNYTNDYLVTDKTNAQNEALFYTYELKFDVSTLTKGDTLEVYKNNEAKIPTTKYKIEYGNITLTDNYYGSNDTALDRYGSGIVWGDFDSTKSVHRVRVLLPIEFVNVNNFYTVRYNKSLYNITTPTHTELIELNPVYVYDTDFTVQDTIIVPTTNSKLPKTGITRLFITKDPNTMVETEGIFSLDGQSYQNDATTSWNIRINTGKFIRNGDYNGNDKMAFDMDFVQPDPSYGGRFQIMSYIKPKLLGGNVIKVDEKPIYIDPDRYKYPNYNIDVFPKATTDTLIPTGTLGIDIDGVNVTDISVSSIDRKKGYMLLNKQITSQQDVNMFFYIDGSQEMYIRNLELNPRISGLYGFSVGSTQQSFKNIGLALRRNPVGGLPGDAISQRNYLYPWFFDFDNISTFYRGSPVPNATPTTTMSGDLIWNPYSNVLNISGEFIPIAHLSVNRLTPDILKIRDARVIGGGLNVENRGKLHNDQLNSFTEVGYYDGEPLPYGGVIVIHMPRAVFNNLVTQWETSDMFNPDLYTDISRTEIEQLEIGASGEYEEYYNNLLEGRSATGDQLTDPYYIMLRNWARKEASHYLDQLINKYVSAGTQYILLDENFTQIILDV